MMTYVLNPDTAFIFSRNIHELSSIGCGLDCINVVHAMSALFSTCAPRLPRLAYEIVALRPASE